MDKLLELKEIRTRKGFTRKELSKLSDISVQNIQALEEGFNNVNNVKLSTLIKLSVALKVKVVDLLPKELRKHIR